jgi:hypothetical protein
LRFRALDLLQRRSGQPSRSTAEKEGQPVVGGVALDFEATFKAAARALGSALRVDPARAAAVPSTKGVL